MKRIVSILLVLAAWTGRSFSQTPQTVNNQDWNAADWGSPAATPTAGNTYITATGLVSSAGPDAGLGTAYTSTLRVNDNGGTNGFAGASLTIAGNTRLLLKTAVGDAASGNLILNNNSNVILAVSGTPGNVTLAGSILVSPGGTAYLSMNNTTAENLNVNSTLTGSGTLSLGTASNNAQSINLDGNVSGFTGNLTVYTAGTFSVGPNVTLSNTALNITSTAANFDLDDALGVKSLTVGSYSFAPGTYTAAQANSLDGSSVFTDTGTITVVSEPAAWMAGLLCVLTIVVARWRWVAACFS